MAVILESLVLRGVLVAGDVVTDSTRLGSRNPAEGQTSASLSSLRYPTAGYPPAGPMPGARARHLRAAHGSVRPGHGVGVLDRWSAASNADGAVLWGWSPAAGGLRLAAVRDLGLLMAKPATSADEVFRQPAPAQAAWAVRTDRRKRLCSDVQPTRQGQTGGTRGAPTRGKRVRDN